jgi:hypothetical protein
MTTEQTVDKIIDARNEHFCGNIDTTEFVKRIGDAVNEARNEGFTKAKAYRDAIEGSIPQSMIDQHVILAEAKGYTRGYNAGLADGTGKPLLAIEQIREKARREERKDLVEWMCNIKGVYSAHGVRMSFISYINAINNREDDASNQ